MLPLRNMIGLLDTVDCGTIFIGLPCIFLSLCKVLVLSCHLHVILIVDSALDMFGY